MAVFIKDSFMIMINVGMDVSCIAIVICILVIIIKIRNMARDHFIGLVYVHLHV